VIALTMQGIITASIVKLWDSSLTQLLAGHRVKKFLLSKLALIA
jgi:hypothetical protein